MFLSAGVIIALAKPAIRILSTRQYHSAWQYIPLLAAATVFSSFSSFMGSVYVVTKRSEISFVTSMAGTVINISLNLLLIPSPLGVQGAAIATFLSYFAVFIIRAVNSRKYIPFKLNGRHIAVNTALIMVQTVFSVLELPFWIPIQAVCVAALTAINLKFLLPFIIKIIRAVKK